MTGYLILVGALLIFAVLFLLYRTQVLLDVARGQYKTHTLVDKFNGVHGILFIIFMLVFFVGMFWYNEVAKKFYLPVSASEHGVGTDYMFWFSMILIIVAFFITNILLFTFPFQYRFKSDRKAHFYPDNHVIELVWTIVPAVVLTGLLFWGLKLWNGITSEAPANSEVIELMGKQFAWQARYPGKDGKLGKYNFKRIDAINEFGVLVEDNNTEDDFMPRELHFPKGKPVLLKIRARDVIHSVFLPHFRVKMDAVPGMQTSFWFTPTISTAEMRKTTANPSFNYELACTEVCGRGHFAMRFLVVVDEPAEYEKWKADQKSWKSQNEDYFASKVKEFGSKTASKEETKKVAAL
jgi:cytochrome c oxidase subunit II